MSDYYYMFAIIAYGIFIVQFLISLFVGDTDTDVDTSSLVSFKGLIHFCMGCSGWLATKHFLYGEVTYMDWIIGLIIGIIFLIVLYFIIYLIYTKLRHHPTEVIKDSSLIGCVGTVNFLRTVDGTVAMVDINVCGESTSVTVYSDKAMTAGETVVIKDYVNGSYYV